MTGKVLESENVVSHPHAMSCSNMDFDFFYSGLENHALLVQSCNICKLQRNPPSPVCSSCGSFEWSAKPLSGRGSIYSYVVHHHPPLPGFETPHAVLVVDMEEGIRFVGACKAADREQVAIGLPVRVEFVRRNDVALFQFALAPEANTDV